MRTIYFFPICNRNGGHTVKAQQAADGVVGAMCKGRGGGRGVEAGVNGDTIVSAVERSRQDGFVRKQKEKDLVTQQRCKATR